MDRAELTPLGDIRRIQSSRLGFVPVYRVLSTLVLRWDVIVRRLGDTLKGAEKIQPVIKNAVGNPGKEQNVSRGEFEQLKDLLRLLHEAWASLLAGMLPALATRLDGWFKASRRGYFRLVLLACIAALQHGSESGGFLLHVKGLGGSIKKALKVASDGQTEAKAGSLYIALEALGKDALVSYNKDDEQSIVSMTPAGMMLLDKQVASIAALFAAFDRAGVLERMSQAVVDAAISLAGKAGARVPPVKQAGEVHARMRALVHELEARGTAPPRDDVVDEATINALHADWLGNFNRGIIDLLVLGTMLASPSYGNRLIKDAAGSLKFQAGTLYPRLAELAVAGLLEKVPPVSQKSLPEQGPERQFYDITPAGATFFVIAWATFLNDARTLFTLLDEIHGPWSGKKHGN